MDYNPVAQVTHYYNKIGVAVLELSGALMVGDVIHIVGHTTDICQMVKSLEIDHRHIQQASPGDDVALKVLDRVREGDRVFKIEGEDAVEFLSKRSDASAVFTSL